MSNTINDLPKDLIMMSIVSRMHKYFNRKAISSFLCAMGPTYWKEMKTVYPDLKVGDKITITDSPRVSKTIFMFMNMRIARVTDKYIFVRYHAKTHRIPMSKADRQELNHYGYFTHRSPLKKWGAHERIIIRLV